MTTRLDGFRKRTRRKFKKEHGDRGKKSIRDFLQNLNVGDRVCLDVEPAYQKGMYRPKYLGKIGVITGKRGRCYLVKIDDISKPKSLIIHPIHLRKV